MPAVWETGLTSVALVAVIGFAIGATVGSTGYGGFLLPAALVGITGMSASLAVTHGLVAGLIPTAMGALLHLRSYRGPSPWGLFGWLCLGTPPGIGLGTAIVGSVDRTTLRVILGFVVITAAVLIQVNQWMRRATTGQDSGRRVWRTAIAVTAAGTAGGIATVLAGVGGPLVTMPVLLALGIGVTRALTAALLHAIVATIFALVPMADSFGQLEIAILLAAGLATLVGTMVGVRLHHRIPTQQLALPVAVVSAASGLWLLLSALS